MGFLLFITFLCVIVFLIIPLCMFWDEITEYIFNKQLQYKLKHGKGLQSQGIRILKDTDIELYLWVKGLMKIEIYYMFFYYLSHMGVLDKFLMTCLNVPCFHTITHEPYANPSTRFKDYFLHEFFCVDDFLYGRGAFCGQSWAVIHNRWTKWVDDNYTFSKKLEFGDQICDFRLRNLGN